jgi:hypothetical protein
LWYKYYPKFLLRKWKEKEVKEKCKPSDRHTVAVKCGVGADGAIFYRQSSRDAVLEATDRRPFWVNLLDNLTSGLLPYA